MSFDYNYKFWVATQKDLEDIIKRQDVFKKLQPVEDNAVAHYLFAELYARYVQLVNKLGYIYHHTFQVQKRDVLKQLVEASSQRVLELKNELKNLELSEFIYIDKTLVERRLTPDDVTIWTPKYFPYWRPTNIQKMINRNRKFEEELRGHVAPVKQSQERIRNSLNVSQKTHENLLENTFLRTMQDDLEVLPKTAIVTMKKQTKFIPIKDKFREALTLIQSHERARVARVYLTNIRYNPVVYKPRIRIDEATVTYEFTHKPTQTMLIPVRRTHFDANYYTKKKDTKAFNYYVKPPPVPVNKYFEEDLSEEVELEEEEQASEEEEEVAEIKEISSLESESSEYESESISEPNLEEYVEKIINLAALKIQTFWKGYRDRKKYKALLDNKMRIYGMLPELKPRFRKLKIHEEQSQEAARNRFLKERYDEEFIEFCKDERTRILRVNSPWIMEDISDNIRAWFQEFYDKLDCFHPYPDELKGGTLLLLRGETMDVFEYNDKLKEKKLSKEQKKKLRDKAKELKKQKREQLKKERLAIAKRRAKYKAAGISDLNDEMERSKSISQIENAIIKYKKEWADIDESLNKDHAPIKDWITSDYFKEIREELQLTVDELMRLEYELLQRALAKDKKKKYKPPKKKKPKVKKGKRKKIPKDLTADRSIESLFQELIYAGIVKTYPRKTFDDYVGERNHCAFDMLNIQMKDTPPFQGEIKDILREYVLGMGPLNVTKPKSICLVGPTHSGKKLLCKILATEIDAVVFDISPENTVQYQSDLKYFVHLILKMSKILQPTILFIRDVHRVFWKKVPAEHITLNPRLLQSQLKKNILKLIKKEDKVFLLGTTNAPWTANKKMKKVFQKLLLVPRTEYQTNFMLHRSLTLQNHGIPSDFDFSSLALVTRDYISGDIVRNIQKTLSLRRRMVLSQRPLNPMEFLDTFLEQDNPHFPMELKDWEKYTKWYRKSSKMAKKRAKMIKIREDMLAKQNKEMKKK